LALKLTQHSSGPSPFVEQAQRQRHLQQELYQSSRPSRQNALPSRSGALSVNTNANGQQPREMSVRTIVLDLACDFYDNFLDEQAQVWLRQASLLEGSGGSHCFQNKPWPDTGAPNKLWLLK